MKKHIIQSLVLAVILASAPAFAKDLILTTKYDLQDQKSQEEVLKKNRLNESIGLSMNCKVGMQIHEIEKNTVTVTSHFSCPEKD